MFGAAGRTRAAAVWFRGAGAGLAALGLGGCDGPLSTLDPAGPAASAIADLWWVMLAGAAVISLIVFTLVAAAFLPSRPLARVHWSRWPLWGGLAFPTVVLSALLVYALLQGDRLRPQPAEDALEIHGTARMWSWEFSAPDGSSPSRNVLRIPAGRPVDLHVTSADVIHSFWIPRLGGKMDAIPGHTNIIRLMADRPGTYRGVCAEFCGVGHSTMFLTVEAVAAESFDVADAARASAVTP
ncbi:cytochrome c oxidase subunit II [Terrihabitans rhizophilus]|uniref:Cytochrome aa3 subunit 2 n=1 Tax=Terrihabitans rhizophilus TaxID=3092662 RepID=A0ABU4RM30_9HYPH|nr:cytochrome c oxidase subunit II [Terrihabitans sp. PJ23]MDX6805881.1 cytochrome c oxidase subunit II [Terrihabitans sp. PJ23]